MTEKPGQQTVKGYLEWCEENHRPIDGWTLYFTAALEGFRKQQQKNPN